MGKKETTETALINPLPAQHTKSVTNSLQLNKCVDHIRILRIELEEACNRSPTTCGGIIHLRMSFHCRLTIMGLSYIRACYQDNNTFWSHAIDGSPSGPSIDYLRLFDIVSYDFPMILIG